MRWAAWFAVTGDLRFLSHHDMMRLMERAAARAKLPLKYSQGFNPHPKLSVTAPRPVGVAGNEELLVLSFDSAPSEDWPGRLSDALPAGVDIHRGQPLPGKRAPQVTAARYKLLIDDSTAAELPARLEQLQGQDTWPVQRRAKGIRGRRGEMRTVDIKPCCRDFVVRDNSLKFTITASQTGSAKPAELLELIGLGGGIALARLTRTKLDVRL